MFFFKRRSGPVEQPPVPIQQSDKTSELLQSAREHLHIEGKEALDAESLETVEQAIQNTTDFLVRMGYAEVASQLQRSLGKEKAFFFDSYSTTSLYGEVSEDIRQGEHLDGFFSVELHGIGINASVLKERGQAGVHKVAVHELLHLASFFLDHRGVRTVEQKEGIFLRQQSGVGIEKSQPGFKDEEGSGEYFTFLNEGLTETIASMIDPSDWNGPHPYHVHRLYVQLLLRALVSHKQKTQSQYSLKDAWLLLVTDYFENTFSFGKEVEVMLGKGALQELARPDKEKARKYAEAGKNPTIEWENSIVRKVASVAGMSLSAQTLQELRVAPRGGSALARLKQMEDETRRAALTSDFVQQAA